MIYAYDARVNAIQTLEKRHEETLYKLEISVKERMQEGHTFLEVQGVLSDEVVYLLTSVYHYSVRTFNTRAVTDISWA